MDQIILYLQENEKLKLKRDKIVLIGEDFDIPDTINSIIMSRIDRLHSRLKKLVKTASVLGKEFSVKVLSSMLGNKKIKVDLKKIEEEMIWSAVSEIEYIFKHALIRDSVYASHLKKTLKSLHRLAGETIEKIFKDNLEPHLSKLAYHFHNAEIREKAIQYLIMSADSAKEKFNLNEEIQHLNLLREYQTDVVETAGIDTRIATSKILLGKWVEAEDMLKKNIKLGQIEKNKVIEFENKLQLSLLYNSQGYHKKSFELLKESLEYLETVEMPEQLLLAYNSMGNHMNNRGDYEGALEYYDKVLELVEKNPENFRQVTSFCRVYANIGITYYFKGDFENARKYYEIQMDFSEKNNDKVGYSSAIGNLGLVYKEMNQYEKALECFETQVKIGKEIGLREDLEVALSNMGIVFTEQDKLDDAEILFKKQLRIAKELNKQSSVCFAYGCLGEVYLKRDELQKAEEYFHKELQIAEELNLKFDQSTAYADYGFLKYKMGEYRDAKIYMDKAIESARDMRMNFYLCEYLFKRAMIGFKLKEEVSDIKKVLNQAKDLATENNRGNLINSILEFGSEIDKLD